MSTPTYRRDTKYFSYYNNNPKGKKCEPDCVIRAIGLATNLGWERTFKGLCLKALEVGSLPNCETAYEPFLKDLGLVKTKIEGKKTVLDFAKEHKEGTYILHARSHFTVVKDGKIFDTWNCEDVRAFNYWKA